MSKITNTSAVHNNGAAELQIGLDNNKFLVKRKGDTVAVVDQDGNKIPIDGASGVYVGEDTIPEGYNVKINPNGAVLKLPTKLGDLEDDIGVISESERGIANGIATLDDDGKIPQSQLPTIDANGTYVGDEAPTNTKLLWVDVDDDSNDIPDDVSFVNSVNGKSGAVTLSAADVGAATAESVNQLSTQMADQKIAIDNSVSFTEQTLTEAQKAQARANIGATAGEDVEFVDSVEWLDENGDTSKKYVLPDGYIYAWLYKSECVEHNVNDGTGYLNATAANVAWGNSGTAKTGCWCSPLIPIDPTKMSPVGNPAQSEVIISGIEKAVPFYNGYSVVVYYYKQDGTQWYLKTNQELASINVKVNNEISAPFTLQLKDINIFNDSNWAQVYGVRIALGISSSSITADDVANLKVNIPFFNQTIEGYRWYSTGQQHSNDKATQQNSADIATLKEEVATLKEAVNTSPSNSGAVWYAIGDSITYGLYSTSATEYYQPVIGQRWVDYVAKHNGYELTNLGVSGSGFVSGTTFRTIVDRNDFSDVDLVTIMLGINDWKNESAVNLVGTMDDDISTGGTIVSELRYGLEKIIADNPYCKIILITPINAKIGSRGTEDSNWAYEFAGTITPCGSLKNFGNKLKEVCEYYGVQVVDMTNSSVVNRKSITTVLPDGIHPNLECYKTLGLELARRITFA